MAKSSSELIDRLAKAPPKTKAALFAGVLIVLGGIYYYLFYSDLADQKASLQSSNARLATEEKKLRQRLTEYQALLRQKYELEESLKANSVKLPQASELPAFFQHLQVQAATANVQLVNWTRDKEIPVETYVKVPVKMEVRGDFYQLNQYFKLLFETPRIITVENLVIGDAKKEGDRRVLTAKFVAATFRQADRAPTPVTPAPATPAAPATPPAGGAKPPAQPAAPAAPAAPAPVTAAPAAPATPPSGTR